MPQIAKVEDQDATENSGLLNNNPNAASSSFAKWMHKYPSSWIVFTALGGFLCVVLVTSITLYSLSDGKGSTSLETMVWSTSNEYGVSQDGMFSYPDLQDRLLLEPYKVTTLALENPHIDFECEYTWTLTNLYGKVVHEGITWNTTFTISAHHAGKHVFAVQEKCLNDEDSLVDTRTLETSATVSYVRREITTLTDEDRETFLDAFHTLWVVNTTEGKALYGEDYKSVHYFAALVNDAASNTVCDELKSGPGFVINHVLLSSYLEQSLQLVNPATCLHYLDYITLFMSEEFQTHRGNQLDGGAWTDIMSDDYFGSIEPHTGHIIDSRWANTRVPLMTADFMKAHEIPESVFFSAEESEWKDGYSYSHVASPYGYLRSRWNYNPSERLSRFNSVNGIRNTSGISDAIMATYLGVTCSDYESAVKDYALTSATTFSQFSEVMESVMHKNFHEAIGGNGGDFASSTKRTLINDYGLKLSDIVVITHAAKDFFESLLTWNDDHNAFEEGTDPLEAPVRLVYPLECSKDPWDRETEQLTLNGDPGDDDGPQCALKSVYTDSEDKLATFINIFFGNQVLTQEGLETMQKLYDLSYSDRADAMNLIVSRMQLDGDLSSGSAALDPLYWVSLGAVEKFTQKVLFEGVLDNATFSSSSTCSGHDASSPKSWLEGYYFANKTVQASALSNTDLAVIVNPTIGGTKTYEMHYSNLLNYVYDSDTYSTCGSYQMVERWFRKYDKALR